MAKSAFSDFFDRHPGLSLALLAAHYPLSAELIETYADEWDWQLLSKNPRLDWTEEFVVRHQERWWEPGLWTNPGILWTAERITRQLGKQVNDEWFYLSQNPSLPVDDAFLTQFAKKINWSWLNQNPGIRWTPALLAAHGEKQFTSVYAWTNLLTTALASGNVAAQGWAAARLADGEVERLRAQVAESERVRTTVAAIVTDAARARPGALHQQRLAEWSDPWLDQLEADIYWLRFEKSPHLPWSLEFVDRYAERLEGNWSAGNDAIWHKVFESQLAEADIRGFLAARYPYRLVKYFTLKGATKDSQGCLPDVRAKERFDEIAEDHYWANPGVIELEHDTIMQGPPRFTDFVNWQGAAPPGHVLVVSERMAAVLKLLSLPEHATYEARVRANAKYQRKYGKEPVRYVVLHFLRDAFLKQLDVAQTPLRISAYRDGLQLTQRFPAGTFATSEEALAKFAAVRRERPQEHVQMIPEVLHPDHSTDGSGAINSVSALFPLRLHGDSDLLWIRQSPVVSETFKRLVAAHALTGMSFAKWGNDSLFFVGAETDEAKRRKLQLVQAGAVIPSSLANDRAGKLFRQLEVRRDAIREREDRIAELQRTETAPTDSQEVRVQAVERKLDVRLPAAYRAVWTGTQKLPRKRGWKWLDLDEVFCIGADWDQSRPEAVRAIAIASNGLGDYLGFLLKEDSMVQLDDLMVEFKHESAMIQPLPSRRRAGP